MTTPLLSLLSGGAAAVVDTPTVTPATGFRDLIAALVIGSSQGEAAPSPDQTAEDRPDDPETAETTVAALALSGVVPALPPPADIGIGKVASEGVTPGAVKSTPTTGTAVETTPAAGSPPVVPPADPGDPGQGPVSAALPQPPGPPTLNRGIEAAAAASTAAPDPTADTTPILESVDSRNPMTLRTGPVEKAPPPPRLGDTPPAGPPAPARDQGTLDHPAGIPTPQPPASPGEAAVGHPATPPERTLPELAVAHRPEGDRGDSPTPQPSPTLRTEPHPAVAEARPTFEPGVAAPTTGPERPAGLEKVVDAIRELAGSRPPRSIAVRLDHLGGVRVTVSLRSDGIHLSIPGGRPEHHALLGDLTSALGREGFDLAGSAWSGTEQRPRHRPDSDDSEARTAPRPPRRSRRVDPDDAVRM